jgi:hypothetical protein
MATGRRWLIVIGMITVALVGSGWWRRSELLDEHAQARTGRRHALDDLRSLRQRLVTTSLAAGAAETDNLATRHATTALATAANSLADQIRVVEQARDDAAVSAWVAGGQVGRMRECLDGINRALNQVSVGDPNSVRTLDTVRAACRAVGA